MRLSPYITLIDRDQIRSDAINEFTLNLAWELAYPSSSAVAKNATIPMHAMELVVAKVEGRFKSESEQA